MSFDGTHKSYLSKLSVEDKILLYNELYADLAGKGIDGDTELAHVNYEEMCVLRNMGGSGDINPNTGLRMFGGGGGDQHSTVENVSEFPDEMKPYITDILTNAQSLYNYRQDQGYTPYEGPQIAGFTPEQQAAMGGIAGLVGSGQRYNDPAEWFTYSGAQAPTGSEIAGYMNPYMQHVVDQEKRELDRANDVQMQQLAKSAEAAGGFGGSRHAIVEAENQRNYNQQLADVQNRGLAASYEDAQRRIAEQRGRETQAATVLSQMGQQIPAQYASQLEALYGIGSQQQQLTQRALDTEKGMFEEFQTYPERTLQQYQSIIRGFPLTPTTYQNTMSPSPSSLQNLAGLAGTAAGAYGAFGGFSKSSGGLISRKAGGRLNKKGGLGSIVIRRSVGGSAGVVAKKDIESIIGYLDSMSVEEIAKYLGENTDIRDRVEEYFARSSKPKSPPAGEMRPPVDVPEAISKSFPAQKAAQYAENIKGNFPKITPADDRPTGRLDARDITPQRGVRDPLLEERAAQLAANEGRSGEASNFRDAPDVSGAPIAKALAGRSDRLAMLRAAEGRGGEASNFRDPPAVSGSPEDRLAMLRAAEGRGGEASNFRDAPDVSGSPIAKMISKLANVKGSSRRIPPIPTAAARPPVVKPDRATDKGWVDSATDWWAENRKAAAQRGAAEADVPPIEGAYEKEDEKASGLENWANAAVRRARANVDTPPIEGAWEKASWFDKWFNEGPSPLNKEKEEESTKTASSDTPIDDTTKNMLEGIKARSETGKQEQPAAANEAPATSGGPSGTATSGGSAPAMEMPEPEPDDTASDTFARYKGWLNKQYEGHAAREEKVQALHKLEKEALENEEKSLNKDRGLALMSWGLGVLAQPGGQSVLSAIGKAAKDGKIMSKFADINAKNRERLKNISKLDRQQFKDILGLEDKKGDLLYKQMQTDVALEELGLKRTKAHTAYIKELKSDKPSDEALSKIMSTVQDQLRAGTPSDSIRKSLKQFSSTTQRTILPHLNNWDAMSPKDREAQIAAAIELAKKRAGR